MGSDIHAYLEYKASEQWVCFATLHIGRNYSLFCALTGTRCWKAAEPFAGTAKGFPKDASWRVISAYTLMVLDDPEDGERYTEEGICSESEAAKWWPNKADWFGKKRIVHPDWHTPSYSTINELLDVQKRYSQMPDKWDEENPTELVVVIAAMKSFAEAGIESRLVFWYDN